MHAWNLWQSDIGHGARPCEGESFLHFGEKTQSFAFSLSFCKLWAGAAPSFGMPWPKCLQNALPWPLVYNMHAWNLWQSDIGHGARPCERESFLHFDEFWAKAIRTGIQERTLNVWTLHAYYKSMAGGIGMKFCRVTSGDRCFSKSHQQCKSDRLAKSAKFKVRSCIPVLIVLPVLSNSCKSWYWSNFHCVENANSDIGQHNGPD